MHLKNTLRGIVEFALAPVARLLADLGIRTMRPGFHARVGHQICELFVAHELIESASDQIRVVIILAGPQPEANPEIFVGLPKPFAVVRGRMLCWLLTPLASNRTLLLDTGEAVAGMRSPAGIFAAAPKLSNSKIFEGLRSRDWNREYVVRQLGLDPDLPIVCVHVREAGYSEVDDALHSYRNAGIEELGESIVWLTDQGYQVVRMGGSYGARVPSGIAMTDYAHSTLKTDSADMALISSCDFFIGNTSGLHCLAGVFGKPVLGLNMTPLGAFGLIAHPSISVPKVYRRRDSGEFVTFRAMRNLGLLNARFAWQFEAHGIEPVSNTATDILLATQEIERLARGITCGTPESLALEESLLALLPENSPSLRSVTRISPAFLLTYKDLISDEGNVGTATSRARIGGRPKEEG
jgi:putative glycosyltransferase (TIGR04372 family)